MFNTVALIILLAFVLALVYFTLKLYRVRNIRRFRRKILISLQDDIAKINNAKDEIAIEEYAKIGTLINAYKSVSFDEMCNIAKPIRSFYKNTTMETYIKEKGI